MHRVKGIIDLRLQASCNRTGNKISPSLLLRQVVFLGRVKKTQNNPSTPLSVGNDSTSSLGQKVVKSQLDGVQGEGCENDQRFGKHDLGKKMKELGLFSLQGRRPVTDVIAMFNYVEGSYREEGNQLCCTMTWVRLRRNGLHLKVARLR